MQGNDVGAATSTDLAKPGAITKYDTNATVAVVSVAMGKDMFGWFREHGFDVDAAESQISASTVSD